MDHGWAAASTKLSSGCNNLRGRNEGDREHTRRGNPNDGFAFNWLSWPCTCSAPLASSDFNCLSPSMASTGRCLRPCEQEEPDAMLLHGRRRCLWQGLDRARATTLCHGNHRRHMIHYWSCHPVSSISIAAGEFNQYNLP